MSEHDFGLSAGRRRHQRASRLWVVGVVALPAFAALLVGLPSLSPVFHLGEAAAGRVGGYLAEALIGVPVGGSIAYYIWRQVNWSRFERLPKYLGLAFVGWSVGMVLSTLVALNIDNPDRYQPAPPGGSVDAAYWRARVADVNTYEQGFIADLTALNRLAAGSAEARARLTRMQAALGAARTHTTGAAAQRQADLEAMGHDEMQRRTMVLAFNERVEDGEAAVTELWVSQAARLTEVEHALSAGRRPRISYATEMRVWESTSHLNMFLNTVRAVPGAGTGLPQFETELPAALRQ
jgi:hypothetical protein